MAGVFLTARNKDPEEIGKEIVSPEIVSLWAGVCNVVVVMVEHASSIVKDDTVELSHGDNHLNRMPHRVLFGDHPCRDEGEGTPGELK